MIILHAPVTEFCKDIIAIEILDNAGDLLHLFLIVFVITVYESGGGIKLRTDLLKEIISGLFMQVLEKILSVSILRTAVSMGDVFVIADKDSFRIRCINCFRYGVIVESLRGPQS